MKMFLNRKVAMLLVLAMIVPIIWNQNKLVADAATTPTFAQSKVEIVGVGETFTLQINNKVAKSTYKWSSSDKNVAKVTNKGVVTSVNKGTATIKCKITYPTKKTKTLSCKVTVTIPAKEISISNAPLVNGAYIMKVGETMDFNVTMNPANSSDKNYWYVWRGDKECLRVDDSSAGIVTATKAGKAVLRVKAAKSSTEKAADLSYVDDAVIVEVVGPTASVKSVEMTSSNEIKVVFDSPVNPNTVLGANGKLLDNIEILVRKDASGKWGNDPGTLTAALSADQMTLTITAANRLDGLYGISFSSKIVTVAGQALEEYYKQISYSDTLPPTITGVTYDDSGLKAYINFSEAIDVSGLKIASAALVPTVGTTADNNTISFLSNVLNYTLSSDKKSLIINLSTIPAVDQNKTFAITMAGIKDLSGNIPTSFTLTAQLRVDTTPRAQAQIVSVIRTSYNAITVTYSRSIQVPGTIQIAGGSPIQGVVDATDPKKVNYTLSSAEALYTGTKKVSVGYWSAYNVTPTDNSSQRYYDWYIDFTGDKTSPYLSDYNYDAKTGILTLIFNEDINLTSASGIFSSTFISIYDDIIPFTNINYKQITHSEGNNIIKLQLNFGSTSLVGSYSFTLSSGFVTDTFRNLSYERSIVISNSSTEATQLPAPYQITQSTTNPNEIYIKFANKLDAASAETVSNYLIPGITVLKAELTENTTTVATVKLTVSTISVNESAWPITISGVKGYKDSYSAIVSYKGTVNLKETAQPYYIGPAVFDTVTRNVVKLNFSEPMKGTMEVKVTQTVSGIQITYTASVTVISNTVLLTLDRVPVNNANITIEIQTNNLTDMNGNKVAGMSNTLSVMAAY